MPFPFSDTSTETIPKKAGAAVHPKSDELSQAPFTQELQRNLFDKSSALAYLTGAHKVIRVSFEEEADGTVARKLLRGSQVM